MQVHLLECSAEQGKGKTRGLLLGALLPSSGPCTASATRLSLLPCTPAYPPPPAPDVCVAVTPQHLSFIPSRFIRTPYPFPSTPRSPQAGCVRWRLPLVPLPLPLPSPPTAAHA